MFLLKIYKNINAKEGIVAGWDPKKNKFIDGLKNLMNTKLNFFTAVA